jgi:hypothetical protein
VTLLALSAAAFLVAAPVLAADKSKADADEIKLVETFLKLPTDELPDAGVAKFVSIDPDTLPKKLRPRFVAKRLELYTLKQMADNKKRGLLRSPEPSCEMVQNAKSTDMRALRMAGYAEISGDDERCLMKETQCTERGLMCEFSLQIVDEVVKGEKLRHYFLYPNDPLSTLLIPCRPGSKVGGNNEFFSSMKPRCTQ